LPVDLTGADDVVTSVGAALNSEIATVVAISALSGPGNRPDDQHGATPQAQFPPGTYGAFYSRDGRSLMDWYASRELPPSSAPVSIAANAEYGLT